jgi:hypothetical protein
MRGNTPDPKMLTRPMRPRPTSLAEAVRWPLEGGVPMAVWLIACRRRRIPTEAEPLRRARVPMATLDRRAPLADARAAGRRKATAGLSTTRGLVLAVAVLAVSACGLTPDTSPPRYANPKGDGGA